MWTAIVVFALILGFIPFAYADYIEYKNLRIEDKLPNVCVMKSDDQRIPEYVYYEAASGVLQWQHELNSYTNSNNWNIYVRIYEWAEHDIKQTSDFLSCNVFMLFDYENTNSTALAYTWYNYANSIHKYSAIYMFSHAKSFQLNLSIDNLSYGENGTITVNISPKPLPESAINTVAKHEFGHALGLLHYNKTLSLNFDSIMIPTFNSNKPESYPIITQYDLAAVYQLYGKQGFSNTLPPLLQDRYGS